MFLRTKKRDVKNEENAKKRKTKGTEGDNGSHCAVNAF